MDTQQRIAALASLGTYLLHPTEAWRTACELAEHENGWFTQEAIQQAASHLATAYLDADKLHDFVQAYRMPETARTVGMVMAGNIPMVGFHDLLCGILSGHRLRIKLSSKDSILMSHLLQILETWAPEITGKIEVAGMLRGCDAYIATGSNNSARYFEEYFGKYPSIIRRNRTSVAILDGNESDEELRALGEDVFQYFGLGCRNVTQICVPEGYDFRPLLQVFEAWKQWNDHNKYRNNYDYHLALYLLNKVPYYDNGCLLLTENKLPFSAVSVLHYRYYKESSELLKELQGSQDIQAIIGHQGIAFGSAQQPALSDFADAVDTLQFLCSL